MTDPMHPSVPPISRRSQPRLDPGRRAELAAAFAGQGDDYDRLRPGYPEQVIDAILGAAGAAGGPGAAGAADAPDVADAAEAPGATGTADPSALPRTAPASELTAVDLGAGTGKLTLALAARGAAVTAVDPSAAMLEVIDAARPPTAAVRTVRAGAEDTGLPPGSADIVSAAQAWHWFDADRAAVEARRLLRPGGVLALAWNTLDVQIPWVHRYSRIMHAGDVQRDDFTPPMTSDFTLLERRVVRWEDPRPTPELIDLARTRSYVITAGEATRARVLANLDWYLHDHLGHVRGATVGLPYRTDLFLYRPTP